MSVAISGMRSETLASRISLRSSGLQRASLFSDPQCQTATQPLVTTGSPAMTTRNRIPAMRFASGSSFTLSKKACLERTGGGVFAPQKREAERRTAHQRLPRLDAQARPRPDKGTARLSALLRGHAPGTRTPPGPRFLELPDANGRTLSGTSAASTSRSGTPDGLMPKPPAG